MPMPTPLPVERQANSLWRPGARAFFKDQRANQIGDILTVTINIADTASLSNSTTRTRNNSESADTSNLLGFERKIWERLPGNNNATLDPTNLINLGSQSSSVGTGQITRNDTVALRVAAIVTQVLPNGNLVVQGTPGSARQLRDARPEDRRRHPLRGHPRPTTKSPTTRLPRRGSPTAAAARSPTCSSRATASRSTTSSSRSEPAEGLKASGPRSGRNEALFFSALLVALRALEPFVALLRLDAQGRDRPRLEAQIAIGSLVSSQKP